MCDIYYVRYVHVNLYKYIKKATKSDPPKFAIMKRKHTLSLEYPTNTFGVSSTLLGI